MPNDFAHLPADTNQALGIANYAIDFIVKGKPDDALIAVIPTLLFLILDTYYLALERRFRASYNSFIKKLHSGELASSDLYAVNPEGSALCEFAASFLSFSVWPLYLTLAAMILLVRRLVII